MKTLLFTVIIFTTSLVSGQSLIKDSVRNAFMLTVNYSYQLPNGDMQDRYGNNSSIGGSMGFKLPHNFVAGIEGAFLFGNKVNEDEVLNNISVDGNNTLILRDGTLKTAFLAERGYMVKAFAGKIFPFKRPNKNSGILVAFGIGLMQHRIRFELEKTEAPHMNETYRKGYDRLSSGLVLSPFLGYQYMSTSRRLNIYGGIELNAGFTKGRRTWNYDTNSPGTESRKDMLLSFKFGWILPIYLQSTQQYYTY